MKTLLKKLLGVDNLNKTSIAELAELYIKDLRKLLEGATRKSDVKKIEDAIKQRPAVVKRQAEAKGLLRPRKGKVQEAPTPKVESILQLKESQVASKKKTGQAAKPEPKPEPKPRPKRKPKSTKPKPKPEPKPTKPTLKLTTKPKSTSTVSEETRKQIAAEQARLKVLRTEREAAIRKIKEAAESKTKPKVKRKTYSQNDDVAYHKRYYRKGGTKKRPQMMHGGAHKSKKHAYAAGGSVKEMKLFK